MGIKGINWSATKGEMFLLHQIAQRAIKLDATIKLMDIEMDITACHLNGCKLRLKDFLLADDFNFAHDVFGIRNHIDRTTGKLKNCFLPRFSKGRGGRSGK